MSRIMHHATTGVLAERDSQAGTVVLDTEDFSGGLGEWATPGVEAPEDAWTRTSQATPTGSTGPAGGSDVTTKVPTAGNFYMYTESSEAAESPWSLEGPVLDVSLGQCSLTFDYHMKFGSVGGIADGTLRVQAWNGSVWANIGPAIIGSQQTTDIQAYIGSTTYTSAGFSNTDFRFRFLFTRGANPLVGNYDCAVDNLVLSGPLGALGPGGGGGGDSRAAAFGTGLRRLHVSKGGAAPLDGSTPDLSFSTIQAALDVMVAGDVITVGAGEYRERPSITGRSGTVAEPIWIASEVPGTVTISDAWIQAKDGNVTWALENVATDRYSASHGDTYMGVHNGDFLPRYTSPAVLDATSVDGQDKPEYGCAFSGGRIHVRLRNGVNPNGQSIIFPEARGRDVVNFFNCDNIIFDGFILEGGGTQAGVDFDTACANPTLTNCEGTTARFMSRVGSNAIVNYCDYRMTGFDIWMRECVALNNDRQASFFDIVKGDLAEGANAVYEGALAAGAGAFQSGTIHTNCFMSFNRMFGVFDGIEFGDFQNSELFSNVFVEIGDDGVSMEDSRNDNEGDNSRVYFNKFLNPYGPVLSHQNDQVATHFVIRNLVQITESIFDPEFLIKTIRTEAGSTVRHAHWYMEHFGTAGTRSPWYPFSTPAPSGGDEIDTFLNNIVVFTGDISPDPDVQSGGFPGDIDGNAYVGPNSEAGVQGTNGVFAGTAKADLDLNADFTLQATSPARGIGQPLPGGFVDPITDPGANDDAGPFPFGFSPGADWPRPITIMYNTAMLPARWTSPGNP